MSNLVYGCKRLKIMHWCPRTCEKHTRRIKEKGSNDLAYSLDKDSGHLIVVMEDEKEA